MVTVIDYVVRKTEDGEEFNALVLQGDPEVVSSQNGGCYVTARKATIPTTLNRCKQKDELNSFRQNKLDRFRQDELNTFG